MPLNDHERRVWAELERQWGADRPAVGGTVPVPPDRPSPCHDDLARRPAVGVIALALVLGIGGLLFGAAAVVLTGALFAGAGSVLSLHRFLHGTWPPPAHPRRRGGPAPH